MKQEVKQEIKPEVKMEIKQEPGPVQPAARAARPSPPPPVQKEFKVMPPGPISRNQKFLLAKFLPVGTTGDVATRRAGPVLAGTVLASPLQTS